MTVEAEYQLWAAWRDRGAPRASRPAGLRRVIPPAWWTRYLRERKARRPRRGQRCVYFSNIDLATARQFARCGPGYTAMISADRNEAWTPSGAYWVSAEILAVLRSGGGRVESWGDGDQTPLDVVRLMATTRKLDGYSGQLEIPAQWDALAAADPPPGLGIGNTTVEALGLGRHLAVRNAVDHGLAVIGEVLHPNPGYDAQGVDISSVAFYVDMDDDQGGYQPLVLFSQHPPGQLRTCSVYGGGRMTGPDWELYRAWTRP